MNPSISIRVFLTNQSFYDLLPMTISEYNTFLDSLNGGLQFVGLNTIAGSRILVNVAHIIRFDLLKD